MPRGQRSEDWTPEMREKISISRRGIGHPRSAETRAKIGLGSSVTRLAEKRECPYGCGLVTNAGAMHNHVRSAHKFVCKIDGCANTKHKGRGYCVTHWNIDRTCRKYGQTVDSYFQLYEMQYGMCQICRRYKLPMGVPGANIRDIIVLDHCHASNKARGLICGNCNIGLGQFQDDPELLMRAAKYLAVHGEHDE